MPYLCQSYLIRKLVLRNKNFYMTIFTTIAQKLPSSLNISLKIRYFASVCDSFGKNRASYLTTASLESISSQMRRRKYPSYIPITRCAV